MYILYINQVYYLKIFSPILGLPFNSVDHILDARNFLILMKSNLYFLLLPVLLVSYPRNHYQCQCHRALPLFSFKSVMILALTFRYLIYVVLIFAYDESKGPTSFFCMWIYSFYSIVCWRFSFHALNYFSNLVKNHLTIYVRMYFFLSFLLTLTLLGNWTELIM